MTSIAPGRYTIKAELPGFRTQTRPGVLVSVGQEITVDFTLPVGAVSEEVTVTEEVPIIEVTSTASAQTSPTWKSIACRAWGASQLSLMQLVPGLTPSLAPGTFEGGQFNANGRDTGSNLFLVDGVYDNDDRLGGSQGTQARVTLDNDLNPRLDYGRTNFDNRHALSFGGNVDVWRGLGVGTVFRYYSGYPIDEIVGLDVNGDRDSFERPLKGRDDATRPIVSPLDSTGTAIRNGIDGESQLVLDLRFQYIHKLLESHALGFFREIYNATNRVNFGNPTGSRQSTNFLVPVRANDPRTMQLGIRYTF